MVANGTLVSSEKTRQILAPIAQAQGMSNEAYVSGDFFSAERDELMAQTWVCVGFASDLAKKRYAKPIEFMGLPLLILRNRHGELQVFHNVCSHRGMQLVSAEGVIKGAIRCPYHSWTYDLDGNLRGTPHIGGVGQHKTDEFHCEDHGLHPVRTAVWMDLVFINLDSQATDFSAHVQPLAARWRGFVGADGFDLAQIPASGASLTMHVNANWKLAVENYCESYHLPVVHRSLNSYSRLEDHYNIQFGEHFSGQGSLAYRFADTTGTRLPRFPSWPEERLQNAEYVSFFPNVLLGIQADHCFAMVLQPLATDLTREDLRVYYVGDGATADEYQASRDATLASWKVVFGEDIGVVEGMQRGRRSPAFSGGVFSPVMDHATHYFHKWLARQLGPRDAGQAALSA